MNIEFLSTVALIAPDPAESRELFVGALGLPLEGQGTAITTANGSPVASRSESGRYLRPLRLASAQRGGHRSGLCRRSASNSMLGTPRRWVRQQRNSSKRDTSCCTHRDSNRGVRRLPGFSRPKLRSSASRTSPCSTRKTDGLQPVGVAIQATLL